MSDNADRPLNDTPLTIEAPTTGEPEPAQMPATTPKTRTKKQKTEFDILGDIQNAFEALPSNAARQRVWEYVTSWLGESYKPTPEPVNIEQAAELLGTALHGK